MTANIIIMSQLQTLNLSLWERVHKLEFMLETEISKAQRDKRRFKRKLTRLAKYLDLKGLKAAEIGELLA